MKMSCLSIFILSLLVLHSLNAQEMDTLWTKTYGSGSGNCIIESADHGYIVVGEKNDDVFILKTNSEGDSLWLKTYGDTSKSDYANSVALTSDSGFIIVGTTESYGAGGSDIWLLKTDANGDTTWTKTYGGDSSDVGNGLQITNDGGYIIVGTTESYGAGGEDAWLLKTDSNGDTSWAKTFGGNGNDNGNCILPTNDGGYIIGGSTESYGGGWLIKTDSNGDTSWTKTYEIQDNEEEWLKNGIKTNDGYVFTGGIPRGQFSDGLIIKTDLLGDTLWTKIVPFGRGGRIECVTSTHDGLYLFSKTYYFPEMIGTEWCKECEIFTLDVNGNEIWSISVGNGHWSDDLALFSVIQTNDSSYVACGEGIRIAKLGYSLTSLELKIGNILNSFSLYQNYPNPFNPSTTIEFTLPKSEFVEMKVYNILGKEISTLVSRKLNQGNHTYTFDGRNLASGVYYYRLEAGNFVQTRKMIYLK